MNLFCKNCAELEKYERLAKNSCFEAVKHKKHFLSIKKSCEFPSAIIYIGENNGIDIMITLEEAAKKYLDDNLNGHTLPLKSWRAEREELTAEMAQLSREYRKLK